jgi:hypothetical protein
MSYQLEKAIRNESILDAVLDWNKNHARRDGITLSTERINELGKTIFLCYDAQKGYWLTEFGSFEKGQRWLNIGWYAETILNEDQKKQIAELKTLYSVASQSLEGKSPEVARETNIAKMQIALGEKCARAYAIIMDNNSNEQELQEINPYLEGVLASIEKLKCRPLPESDMPNDYDLFTKKLEASITTYFITLQKNYKKDLREAYTAELNPIEKQAAIETYKKADETEWMFKLYFNKVLDSDYIKPRWCQLEGYLSQIALYSISIDIDCFLQMKQGSLTQNDAERLSQIQDHLKFADNVTSHEVVDEEKIEIEIKNNAEQIHSKLTSYAEQTENSSGSIVLSGGCKRHAVLYQIKKNDSGTYDFSIINTGNGATIILSKKGYGFKSQDVVYTGLTLNELSEQFFFELLNIKMTANDMKEVFKFLDSSLLNHSAKKVGGMERVLQKKGTCTFRRIMEWLKTELGKELFREFKLFMLERAIQRVEEAATTISPTALRFLFPLMPGETTTDLSKELTSLIDAGKQQLDLKKYHYSTKK